VVVDDDGCVRAGKGEGMRVGVALARLAGRDAVGFVDADNYVPGAVREYVKCYAAGLHLGRSPYTMVRISWRSKPKIEEERLFFHRSGRVSRVTNHFLNALLGEYSGFATDVIATGNAGEHAMTMELATRLRFAGGFAVEPHQFVELFERFGGALPSTEPEVMKSGVDLFQIETRNPHLHEDKGSEHVEDMRLQALACLYRSPICPEAVRNEIRSFLDAQGIGEDGLPAHAPVYPPLSTLDDEAFLRTLLDKADTFEQVERMISADVVTDVPINVPDDGTPPSDR
jgi:mannosyl-3-phosphoglycerate synthase